MKVLHCAIAASTALTLLTTSVFQVFARPIEPDYLCYMKKTSGQIVNLTPICEGKPVAAAVAAASSQKERPQLQEQDKQSSKANSGQVVETAREIQDNGSNSWTLSGKVQNQTQQTVSSLRLTLNIQSGAENLTQDTYVTQGSLEPGGYGNFRTQVVVRDHRPDFHVVSARWTNEDGSTGNYP